MKNGSFIISLDFELHWGGVELWDINKRKEYFLNTRAIILEMLQLFNEYNIRATWATVGFLFGSTREEISSFFPELQPSYHNQELNYYNLFKKNLVGAGEEEDPFHYGASLIEKILGFPGQELASHTFSHYYCNEKGQTQEQFNDDLKASQKIAVAKFNKKLSSLVFPRNQYNEWYLQVLGGNSYTVVRTNPDVWFWKIKHKFIPLVRAVDTLFSVSERLSYTTSAIKTENGVVLLPASRFFRPYDSREKGIQNLKMRRIKNEMTKAARRGEHYHLWWHPHNFGYYPKENLKQLRAILEHYKNLNVKFGFVSKNMGDFACIIKHR